MEKKFSCASLILALLFIPIMVRADYVTIYSEEFQEKGNTDPFINAAVLYIQSGGTVSSLFYAPLHLPDNAKIVAMTVFFVDQSSKDFQVRIWRTKLYSVDVSQIVSWSSSGAIMGLRNDKTTNVNFAYNKIMNSGATYHIEVTFPNGGDATNLVLYAVRIFYKTT